MILVRAKVHISGRVQGVWFRQSTKDTAQQHAVTGWCRNNPDGTVEAVFEGAETAVKAVLDWCKKGPELAHVDDLQIEWADPTGEFEIFQIR
ncbi:MAG: acylphosphatase [Deltaproteobacteria bacterium]|jgi:acylphosphatase|nr:acylphosphatase [Deltaproteobacteria bacterium]MCW8892913.1 acylphosphatase [Deltaproteobacteria bacterium]MCW9048746.1 acylphosphatase [Deltaproteobacteria bacterium]